MTNGKEIIHGISHQYKQSNNPIYLYR